MAPTSACTATLFSLACLLLGPGATAQVYKWVDDQGNVHFGDRPRDESEAAKAREIQIKQAYEPSPSSAAGVSQPPA
ncbi:MAG: DUF4124 domain-containing protein, partial [Halioglobus sp.]|nr:DUF4124 domain-containing protein [Halioglobus sp.]